MKFVRKWVRTATLCTATLVLPISVAAPALAATSGATWTSQEDFEANAATTGETTTRAGIDTASAPGSVTIGPKQLQNNGVIYGRYQGIATTYNPVTNRVYVSGGESVSITDATSNETVGYISSVGKTYSSMVTSTVNNKIYALNTAADTIDVFDGATNKLITTIPVATGGKRLIYNPGQQKVYLTHDPGNAVSVIDGTTDQVVNSVPVGTSPLGGVYDPANNRLYVMNKLDVSVIDCSSEQVVATIAVLPSNSYFRMVEGAVNASGSKIYASDRSSLVVIDTASNQVTKTLVLAGWSTSTAAMAYDGADNKLYLLISGATSLTVIDGATDSVLRTIPLSSQYVSTIVYAQNTGKVFAGDDIISTATDTVLAKQKDLAAADVVHDAAHDRLYVLGDNVTVLDVPTGAVLKHVDVGTVCYSGVCTNPKAGTLNTRSNKLIVIKGSIGLYGTPHIPSSLAIVDAATYQVLNTVSLSSDYALEAVYGSQNNQVYIFYPASTTVSVHDGETGAQVKTITLPKITSYAPKGVYQPATNKIYVDGIIIDCATDTATGSIAVTGRGTVDPNSSRIFFVNSGITTVDSATDQVLGTFGTSLPGIVYMSRIAFDAAGNRLLGATSTAFYALDPATGAILESTPIPASSGTKAFFDDNTGKSFLLRSSQGNSYGGVVYSLSEYASSALLGGNGARTALRADTFAAGGGATLFDTYSIRYSSLPLKPGQNVRFRVRTADDDASLALASYFGPDGTNRSWYDAATPGAVTDGNGTLIPLMNALSGFTPAFKRFVEIEIELDSNGAAPVVQEVGLQLTTIDPPLASAMEQTTLQGTPIVKATNNTQLMLRITGVPSGMYAEYEVRPEGTPFSNTPTATGTVADASGTSSAVITAGEGRYHWQARLAIAPTRSSLWSGFPGNLVIDTTPPALGITMQTVQGTREAGATVTVMSGAPVVVGDVQYPTETSWSCTLSYLAPGPNAATITAADEAGNLNYTTLTLYGY